MKALKLSILAAIMLAAGAQTVKAQDVDEILKKHEEAIGSAEKWSKVKTMKFTGNISTQGMEIPITESIVMGKALRMDFTFMGQTGFQIVNMKEGYMYQPGMPKFDTMPMAMVKMQQKQLDVKANQLSDYKEKGTKAEYTGKDSVDDALCYKIKFTDKDGNVSTSYFDTKTYYLMRTESVTKVDDQDQEVAVTYKDYKKLPEGVVMPMTINQPAVSIAFKTIEMNQPIDEKIFIPTMPAKK